MLTHKEQTAKIRAEIKAAGINARCRKLSITGSRVIQVYTPAIEVDFTDAEQHAIKEIALAAGLGRVMGTDIDLGRNTDPQSFNFYLRG